MSVGNAPWLGNPHRRTQRAQINPLDKSTIVSIYPKPIYEVKHTIQPGTFRIEAGSYEKPALLVVGPSSWWRELDEEQPLLEIPVSSVQIAESVVKDYANGLLDCNMADVMPGLFFIIGEQSFANIKVHHKAELDKALENQKRWYTALVRTADTLWSRTNGNPLSISDDMRLAAQELNLTEKPWLQDFTTVALVNCPFCGTLVKPGFPVCITCHHVINPELYAKMKPVVVETK